MIMPRRTSIKARIITVIMLTTVAVLLMTVIAFMFYDLVEFRQSMVRNLTTQAQIIAQNSSAALAYQSEKDARETLSSLRAEPHITAAALYDNRGKLFVKFPANVADALLPLPNTLKTIGHEFKKSRLIVFEPVTQFGSRKGTLYLCSDLTALFDRLELYGLIAVLIMLGSSLIALWLSDTLQRRISDPIIALSQTARKISEQRDYSVRAASSDTEELGQLTDSFNEMLGRIQTSDSALRASEAQAQAASRAKDDFLAALSHELRTPLNPVLLLASEAAANQELPAEVRENFEAIVRNITLEARLIDDLLDLTRITRNKLLLDKEPTDLHAILRNAIATVRADIEAKKISFSLNLQAEHFMVLGDTVRLQQIFWNVLKNAVKFTGENGKISVVTRNHNENLRVTITDTGIGLTETELARVFDAFVQGEHAEHGGSHRFGGLGLGLAISQKLAELHSGVIEAFSSGRDQGATFTIEFPLLTAPEKEMISKPISISEKISTPVLTGHRILLVEDHDPTRLALSRLLARRNYEVFAAASVAEARALAAANKFDLLISDIGLPDGSGYTLMTEFRELYHLKGIALTGYGMENDIANSRAAGFSAHLTKPVHVQALENALASAGAVAQS
jgi:signal transduction histidine kinase